MADRSSDRGTGSEAAEIRDLRTMDEFVAAGELVRRIWGTGPDTSPLNVQQLPAMAHAGNQISGAFLDGRMVAATMAFFGLHEGEIELHSHVTGVHPDHQGAGLGLAMKRYQREWCRERGIGRVVWTFDPLVRRNGWFNLGRLGAVGTEYHRDLYGSMPDAINRNDPTDRLVAVWDIDGQRARRALDGAAARPDRDDLLAMGAVDALVEDPCPTAIDIGGPLRLLAVPEDIEAMRSADPERATAWRFAHRRALESAFEADLVVLAMTGDGAYVMAGPDWSAP